MQEKYKTIKILKCSFLWRNTGWWCQASYWGVTTYSVIIRSYNEQCFYSIKLLNFNNFLIFVCVCIRFRDHYEYLHCMSVSQFGPMVSLLSVTPAPPGFKGRRRGEAAHITPIWDSASDGFTANHVMSSNELCSPPWQQSAYHNEAWLLNTHTSTCYSHWSTITSETATWVEF